jgi:hypothetical protein
MTVSLLPLKRFNYQSFKNFMSKLHYTYSCNFGIGGYTTTEQNIVLVNKIHASITFNLSMGITIIEVLLLKECNLFHNYCTDQTITTVKISNQ